MKTKKLARTIKLGSQGFSHDILLAFFIVLFAVVGIGYLVASHADPTTDTSLDSVHTELPQYLPPPPGSTGALTNSTNNSSRTQTTYNPIWTGMVFLGQAFTQTAGDVTVPTLHCKSSYSRVSEWVGLGGGTGLKSDPTVQQTGFITGCNGSTQIFEAWWEMFDGPHYHGGSMNLPIHPGDRIHMQVLFTRPYYHFWLKNLTTNVNAYDNERCYVSYCSIQTAEWVFERFSHKLGGPLIRLADFGTEHWSNTHWNVEGKLNPSAVTYRIDDMIDKKDTHYLAQVIPDNTGINNYPIVWRNGY